MSVAQHLGIRLRDYDARIRTFIPRYEEMLDAAASALTALGGSESLVVDLGTGSGALAKRVAATAPGTRIIGIDTDDGMLAFARKRLGARLTTVSGDFLKVPLPPCDAVTASFALHHIRTRRQKARMYARCFAALPRSSAHTSAPFDVACDAVTASFALHHIRTRRQKARMYARCFAAVRRRGVLVSADVCLADNSRLQATDRAAWRAHLQRRYGRPRAEEFLRAWAQEDVYFRLKDEVRMLRAAGFVVDVPWRREGFAVIAGVKKA